MSRHPPGTGRSDAAGSVIAYTGQVSAPDFAPAVPTLQHPGAFERTILARVLRVARPMQPAIWRLCTAVRRGREARK